MNNNKKIDISIVIPLFNEEQSLVELVEWIKRSVEPLMCNYEIIMIDDGSTDNSWKVITELSQKHKEIKGIKFIRNYGKSAALQVGFTHAEGEVVITMDADLQDSPEEIPELYRMIKEENFDVVSGWKLKRYDPLISKRIPSKIYNFVVRKISGIYLHDMNCGLKAYKNIVVKSIEVYGEMHRYIPVLAKNAGFKRIGEKVVKHYERKYGTSKFGVERFIRGPLDLMTVMFITHFSKRPMHFFGVWGLIMFFLGGVLTVYLLAEKVYKSLNNLPTRDVTDKPHFYLAIAAIIIGVQLFLAGFIAELISRTSPERNKYIIEKKTF
ncbi:MAG: glycosyltransferase family 2 protein [Bacteroidales bacterium]|nr:glycosyltransferase family 2 protein [Bacteroidales bacterium]